MHQVVAAISARLIPVIEDGPQRVERRPAQGVFVSADRIACSALICRKIKLL